MSRTFGTDWGCAFPEGTYWRTPTASEWDYLLNGATRGNKRFMMVEFVFIKQFNGKDHSDYCRGLLLFPDDFVEPEGLHRTYQAPSGNTLTFFSDAWYNKTDQYYIIDRLTYSTSGDGYWNNPNSNMYKLLAAGCVFLPAVGMRAGGTDDYGTHSSSDYYIYDYYKNVASGVIPQGYYWTASCDGYETWSKYLWIGVTGGMYYAVGTTTTNATETFGVHNMMANVPNMREIGMCVRLVWDAN